MYRIRVSGTNSYVNVTISRAGISVDIVEENKARIYDSFQVNNAVNVLTKLGIVHIVEVISTTKSCKLVMGGIYA